MSTSPSVDSNEPIDSTIFESTPARMRSVVDHKWHLLWLVLILVGFSSMIVYASLPGKTSVSLTTWPQDLAFQPAPHRACLVFFMHPRCPCTKASLNQLKELFLLSPDCPFDVKVLVFDPTNREQDWTQTLLLAEAKRLPHTDIVFDTDGKQAQRLGAFTSGHVLLFDADRNLVFSGGITPSRGHIGNCDGFSYLSQWILGGSTSGQKTAATYGCPIIMAGQKNTCTEASCLPQ